MNFIRPEARAVLWQWRECLVGGAFVLFGFWLILGPGFLLSILGYAALAAGGALIWLGVQRARFRGTDGGPGMVRVDEGQVSYFGPLTGGMIAVREMSQLSLDGRMFPAHWQLEQPGVPALMIPVNATGAESLFDAFATLPGIETERMLSLLRSNPHQTVVIWQRDQARPQNAMLH